ncbi:hypothetical protein K501DRAFT_271401 [Backusella circina FSU 941]|nr:hypothetical protein K501DRAFT_271401 [Backusella circina FSU 941]
MDILTDYVVEKECEKLVLSSFFKKERAKIELYCNNLQPNNKTLDLKMYWAEQSNEFTEANPTIQAIKDYCLIDFTDFESTRKNLKLDVLETRSAIVNSMLELKMVKKRDELVPYDLSENQKLHREEISKTLLQRNEEVPFICYQNNGNNA